MSGLRQQLANSVLFHSKPREWNTQIKRHLQSERNTCINASCCNDLIYSFFIKQAWNRTLNGNAVLGHESFRAKTLCHPPLQQVQQTSNIIQISARYHQLNPPLRQVLYCNLDKSQHVVTDFSGFPDHNKLIHDNILYEIKLQTSPVCLGLMILNPFSQTGDKIQFIS